jgi:gluconolactonase
MRKLPVIALLLLAFSCKVAEQTNTLGSIERLDAALDNIVDPSASLEILSDGYDWSEGPVWVESEKMLLFSDVPMNTVYKWSEADSIEVYLKPSGYTAQPTSTSSEPGSNGLTLDPEGKLVLCQHGDRRLALLDAPLNEPKPSFTTLADSYDGKKFNSPNDVVVRDNGDYFFTDPPYGMPKDVAQEIPFQGVYKLSGGTVTLLVDSITRPNGIAFIPGTRTLIIANSDPEKAVWYAYDVDEHDSLTNGRIFYDVTSAVKSEPGLPGGLKVDRNGNVFGTGPGGIWIFDRNAKLLGKIKIPVATGNCAFSQDEKTLFITADNYLLRLNLRK